MKKLCRGPRDISKRSFVHGKIDDFRRRMTADTKHLKNVVYTPGKLPALSPPDFIFR